MFYFFRLSLIIRELLNGWEWLWIILSPFVRINKIFYMGSTVFLDERGRLL